MRFRLGASCVSPRTTASSPYSQRSPSRTAPCDESVNHRCSSASPFHGSWRSGSETEPRSSSEVSALWSRSSTRSVAAPELTGRNSSVTPSVARPAAASSAVAGLPFGNAYQAGSRLFSSQCVLRVMARPRVGVTVTAAYGSLLSSLKKAELASALRSLTASYTVTRSTSRARPPRPVISRVVSSASSASSSAARAASSTAAASSRRFSDRSADMSSSPIPAAISLALPIAARSVFVSAALRSGVEVLKASSLPPGSRSAKRHGCSIVPRSRTCAPAPTVHDLSQLTWRARTRRGAGRRGWCEEATFPWPLSRGSPPTSLARATTPRGERCLA